MLGMILDSMKLFFTGRLFQDYRMVAIRFLVAVVCGALTMLAVGHFFAPLTGAIAGGAVAGFLQPILFKDLKYR
ncbi:MAG: hypothetical protein CL955_10890 [Erythrobacteraceae bacterium]|jgi:hypothetical protein|nr:hypothetical protein [Erythrobacteraceae bacterium]|tara:strand:+ start:415 stop:636 length:222 start_codon:yes stop_codon:yes gene_type:complete